jgi:hypothetical protein
MRLCGFDPALSYERDKPTQRLSDCQRLIEALARRQTMKGFLCLNRALASAHGRTQILISFPKLVFFASLPSWPQPDRFPVGRSSWWAGIKSGRFPKPVKLGPRTTAWRVEDIRALIERGVP